MKVLTVLVVVMTSMFLMGCSGTKIADSKPGIKAPAKSGVKDTRPRPFPAGIK
jgi:hypothetical protein